MAPMSDQKLAYEAMIELLAHQFAYPVRWIETQDALLGDAGINKVTEIGPSSTLTVMAKRTASTKYKDHDQALSIKREFLGYQDDTDAVLFENHPCQEQEPVVNSKIDPKPLERVEPVPLEKEAPETQPKQDSSVPSAVIAFPDEPVAAKTVATAIIAYRLKKQPSAIDPTSSIKTLVGGRSTLENEIVGDLLVEFGSVPERAEELSVQELAGRFQLQGFSGSPGQVTTGLINKLIANKLSSGFDKAAVSDYLNRRWGMATGRQVTLLLSAACRPPASRLLDHKSCKAFLDDEAGKYLKEMNLSLPQSSDPTTDTGASVSVSVDPEFMSSQKRLFRQKLELYAQTLGIDLNAGAKDAAEARDALTTLEDELAMWSTEHGEAYREGIKPMFDAAKIRNYDSAWAWAVQDTIALYHKVRSGGSDADPAYVEAQTRSIANRANSDTIDVTRYLLMLCEQSAESCDNKSATTALRSILERVEPHGKLPVFCFDGAKPTTSHGLQIKKKTTSGYATHGELTKSYTEARKMLHEPGISFSGRHILVTGAGPSSIGWHILQGLLCGGAKVVVTTASFGPRRNKEYQRLFSEHGAQGSQLTVLPFNQGSQADVDALVNYIYDVKGLNWDLDTIIPFAAIPEQGEIDSIGSQAELAHRAMLINTIRLIGAIKPQKQKRGLDSSPATVLLPLSANHGIFGGDGLYSESKIALESLFNKWYSEQWQDYLCICGVGIGWTRGTGLMKSNDVLADAIEAQAGIKTFSQAEMAANILTLLDHSLAEALELEPLYADFNGGLGSVKDFTKIFKDIQQSMKESRDVEAAVRADMALDARQKDAKEEYNDRVRPRGRIRMQFPRLPSYEEDIKPLPSLQDMIDLNTVVVIAGFAELGPWGNSRTRWDMESTGTFTLEGWVEMAWMMGLIRYASSGMWNGAAQRPGWFDTSSGEPVHDSDIESRYGQQILSHTGIRLVEPELWGGYDPKRKQFLQEIALESDLAAFEASQEVASEFKRQHGSHCDVIDGKVYLKKGATLMVPKAAEFKTVVAGQLPTGFNPRTYGISDEIIAQVDPLSLYALICSTEALFSAGISDPYELYQHVHVSEVGSCIGTGVGPVKSAADMYKGRTLERDVPSDILQETFPNTVGAWVNMLLLSSSGAIRTPVGACATSIESLESAHDLITTGKAKLCLVGGVDDLEEHSAYEFAKMRATNPSDKDFAAGRDPSDMSRPTASDRRGFLESQGCGIQVVCTARLALDMGLPVHGVVASAGMSGDKVGRSVPAPGQGVLSNAKEVSVSVPSPLLSLDYRKRQIVSRMKSIEQFEQEELAQISEDLVAMNLPVHDQEEFKVHREKYIRDEAERQRSNVLHTFGNAFWRSNAQISPLRGSLATWGLTIDDLDVVSFHGTSTVKNEKNECSIIQQQLTHLGRAKGNRVLGIFQKHLTGHPKGPAGAWMINGCLQVFDSGLVPGNKNADNIDRDLEQYDRVAFLNKRVQTQGVKAASVMSFGFGQKGGQAVLVHPKYLFSSVSLHDYEVYCTKTRSRQQRASSEFERRMVKGQLFQAKVLPPFMVGDEKKVFLNPEMRL
ncbi:hypothetical protein F66182_3268 [Fusarium sp. NRRL 66182]|nr:hypothetical protein F66182_3268 [Fusarium sp. NRRL 66182]